MVNRLKAVRKKLRIKQGDVCSKLGISIKTLYNYEQGNCDIPSRALMKLAKIYDTTVDYLLGVKKHTTITVTDPNGEVVAVVTNSKIVERTGYTVTLTED